MYQGIAAETGRLDNIVELRQRALPNLPFLPANQPSVATLTLKHAYSIVGTDQVEITFIGTDVNVEGEPSMLARILTPRSRAIMRGCKLLDVSLLAITVHGGQCCAALATELRTRWHTGGLGGILSSVPQISLPDLPDSMQPPSRSARFTVTYLDDDLRITRGDRGETRVFVRT